METKDILLSDIQIFTLKQMLTLELNTNLKMSRKESALQAFTRLTGINTGKGKKGREKALEILERLV